MMIYKVEEFVEELERLEEEAKSKDNYWVNNYRMLLQYKNKNNAWKDVAWTTPKLTSRYVYKKIREKEYIINEDGVRYLINDNTKPIVMKYLEEEGCEEVHTDYHFELLPKKVTLVCPDCFRQECICPKEQKEKRDKNKESTIEKSKENGEEITEEDFLLEIDSNILPIIQLLNDKGYGTRYCCEGHPLDLYISFLNDFEELADCPIKDIEIVHQKSRNYYNRDKSQHYDYIFYRNIKVPYVAFAEDFPDIAERLKKELLEDLMMWIETLPHAKVNWKTDCCYLFWN